MIDYVKDRNSKEMVCVNSKNLRSKSTHENLNTPRQWKIHKSYILVLDDDTVSGNWIYVGKRDYMKFFPTETAAC